MNFFPAALREISQAGFPAVLIGGLAVDSYLGARTTYDVDFVIPEQLLGDWKAYLVGRSWKCLGEREAFIQWERENDRARLDLMIVNTATFEPIWNSRVRKSVAGVEIDVVSPQVLVAMKLHASRYRHTEKAEQDWADLLGLIRIAGYDVDSLEFQQLVSRYGAPFSYERIRQLKSLGHGSSDSAPGSV